MEEIIKLPNIETIVSILVSLVGMSISLSTRRKAHADAADSITKAAQNIVTANQHEMDRLRVVDIRHEKYINYLLEGIIRLQRQLRRHKLKPNFNPLPFLTFIEQEKSPE